MTRLGKPSPPLLEWSTLAEAADWLTAETDVEWSWRRVLAGFSKLSPKWLTFVRQNSLSGLVELSQVADPGNYLWQVLLCESLDKASGVADTGEQIPARAVRLSKEDIYAIAENAEGYDLLIAELCAGKLPELDALLRERELLAEPALEEELELGGEEPTVKVLAQEIAAAKREQAPQDAPALVERSPSKPRARTQKRAESLAALLDEIETRANDAGILFNRAEWPGIKAELTRFIEWYNPHLRYSMPNHIDNVTDELHPLGVKFLPGNNRGKGLKFYCDLFPDYRPS